MKTVLRYLLAGIIFMLWIFPLDVLAQKTIEVTVYGYENSDRKTAKPAEKIAVLGFDNVNTAKKLKEKIVAMDEGDKLSFLSEIVNRPKDVANATCMDLTDAEGLCLINLPPNSGAVIVIPESAANIEYEALNGRTELKFYIPQERTIAPLIVRAEDEDDDSTMVDRSQRSGNSKYIDVLWPIYRRDSYSNVRVGVVPYSRIMDSLTTTAHEDLDTFAIVRPFIQDGKAYRRTQDRRMGYKIERDVFSSYFTEGMVNKHSQNWLPIKFTLKPLEKGKHYRVDGILWYQDYNGVYRQDTIEINDGSDKEPMRFLEMADVNYPIDLDREYYRYDPDREKTDFNQQLILNFEVNKANISPTDTVGLANVEKLKVELKKLDADPDLDFYSGSIIGIASPEGNYASNKALALRRAQFLRDEIARTFVVNTVTNFEVTSIVSSWDDVAMELDKAGFTDYAAKVRACKESGSAVARLSFYNTHIKDSILPRLRGARFEFSFVTKKKRTPEEIIEYFENDSGYRDGSKPKPYEFHSLFKHKFNLNDSTIDVNYTELEALSKGAYERVYDRLDASQRKWPLAAYHLAKCYLKRDHIDTLLLKPYFSWNKRHVRKDCQPFMFQNIYDDGTTKYAGWYNDPAIVCTQIAMMLKAGDYVMADSIRLCLLPKGNPYFEEIGFFIKCLRGYYEDPKVRNAVANTSLFNKVVIYAAQKRARYQQEALKLAEDSTLLNQKDPRVKYMQATLRYKLNISAKIKKEIDGPLLENIFKKPDYYPDDPLEFIEEEKANKAGYPMIECLELDESFLNIVRFDGEFDKRYRKSVEAYWKKLKAQKAKVSAATTE